MWWFDERKTLWDYEEDDHDENDGDHVGHTNLIEAENANERLIVNCNNLFGQMRKNDKDYSKQSATRGEVALPGHTLVCIIFDCEDILAFY